MKSAENTPLIAIEGVSKIYDVPSGWVGDMVAKALGRPRGPAGVRAVQDVDLTIYPGEVVGIAFHLLVPDTRVGGAQRRRGQWRRPPPLPILLPRLNLISSHNPICHRISKFVDQV